MADLYYFAYGSNLHPVRLAERVPSSRHLCTVRLDCHRLAFNKRGRDGSGKCNILCTENPDDYVYGAIFRLLHEEKERLDHFEGRGKGYRVSQIQIEHDDTLYNCFTYAAQSSHIDNTVLPYDWYRELVILGAEYLAMPDDYIDGFREIECIADMLEARRTQHHELIEKLQAANNADGPIPW
jgi:gamma-glutamylcyclotransferase